MYTVRGEECYFYIEDEEVHEMFIDFIYSIEEEKSYYGY